VECARFTGTTTLNELDIRRTYAQYVALVPCTAPVGDTNR